MKDLFFAFVCLLSTGFMVSCSQEEVSAVDETVPVTRAVVELEFPTITYDTEPGTNYTWVDETEEDLREILEKSLEIYDLYFVAPGVVEFDMTDQGVEDGKVTMTIPGIDVEEWTVNIDMITYATLRFDSLLNSIDINLDIIPDFVSIATSFTVDTDEPLNVPIDLNFTASDTPFVLAEVDSDVYINGGLARIVELAGGGVDDDSYFTYEVDMSSQGVPGGAFELFLKGSFNNWTVEINTILYEYLLLHPENPVFAFVELVPGEFTFTFNISATEE
ncbi:MAG: hypothetical protein LUF04_03315 [Bacteroides sp.]|nr:hypothetical protein [Bacteroides sp.]